ncbi:MAG: hypothetical protein COB78_10845 [Hyphomicrobiales bacterium]|nr:MAG: hypothetical protein COB78_10845 [Hyphomicrobiales bacterium]
MEIIYSATPVDNAGDRKTIDPKDFYEPVKGVSCVYYDGDNLKLKFGYETRGIPVKPISKLPKAKTSKKGD